MPDKMPSSPKKNTHSSRSNMKRNYVGSKNLRQQLSKKDTTLKNGRRRIQTSQARYKESQASSIFGQTQLSLSRKRLIAFGVAIILALVAVSARAIQLQAIESTSIAEKAAKLMEHTMKLTAKRGSIMDRDGEILAVTEPAVSIYANPKMVKTNGIDTKKRPMTNREKEKAAKTAKAISEILAKHLGGDTKKYLDKLNHENSGYEMIAKRVPAYVYGNIANEMRNGGWNGIYSESTPIRRYPSGYLAGNLIGFVNNEGKGAAGFEYAQNKKLSGTPGTMTYDSSPWGKIPLGTNTLTPAKNGISYELTLDSPFQFMVQRSLANAVTNAGAQTGIGIAMNVKTGEILAMATVPTFDPNDTGKQPLSKLGNPAVDSVYEPGSVEKTVTMAAMVDNGIVTPDSKIEVPEKIGSGNGYIRDAWSHGTLKMTARGVLAKSSNIGMVKLVRGLSKEKLNDYLQSFGFGKPLGMPLPGEASGYIPDADMPDYSRDQIAFGQGMSVTPIQMAGALATIGNGGIYVKPQLIKAITLPDGTKQISPKPQKHRVVSKESAAMVLDMMQAVTYNGENKGIEGYRTAEKSGTAQRPDPKTKTYKGYTSSYIGLAPADNPEILVYVIIDNPTKGHFGSEVAKPAYSEIMKLALNRYGIPPSNKPVIRKPLEY